MRSALIVASYDYLDPGLRALRAPAQDAEALGAVLRNPQIGGFAVRTMLNEPAHVINEAVEEFFDDRVRDDLLLMHFSCHGIRDEDGRLFFAASNTKLRRLGATAVAADFVNREMDRSRSRRIVLLLDCCYAGAFGQGMVARAGTGIAIEEQLGGRGRAVITASSALEYAFEGGELADGGEPTPSVFTSALVEGLATGDADRDLDGQIALDELYDYVYDKVRDTTPNQTPGKWTFGVEGDLYVARRSRPVTTAAPLPTELQEAIDHPLPGIRLGAVHELARLLTARHAGLVLAADQALERLGDDDSRTVAAAALAALGARRDSVVPEPAAGPEPGAGPGPGAGPEPVSAAASKDVAEPLTAPGHTTAAPSAAVDGSARGARAGQLAIVGAVMLVVGLFQYFQWDTPLAKPEKVHEFSWYVVVVALLALGAGASLLKPGARPWIGHGLVLAAAAASTWGLVYLGGYWFEQDGQGFGSGFGLQIAGHLLLMTAAWRAATALPRGVDIRLESSALGELHGVPALLGVAGALALLLHYRGLAQAEVEWPAMASIWAAALSIIIPACVVAVVPRRFGVTLLSGWVMGAAALFAFYFANLVRLRADGWTSIGPLPVLAFGLTFIGLMVTAVVLRRARPAARVEPVIPT